MVKRKVISARAHVSCVRCCSSCTLCRVYPISCQSPHYVEQQECADSGQTRAPPLSPPISCVNIRHEPRTQPPRLLAETDSRSCHSFIFYDCPVSTVAAHSLLSDSLNLKKYYDKQYGFIIQIHQHQIHQICNYVHMKQKLCICPLATIQSVSKAGASALLQSSLLLPSLLLCGSTHQGWAGLGWDERNAAAMLEHKK